jgi:hypothetical protein
MIPMDQPKLSDETLAELMRDQPETEAAGAWLELPLPQDYAEVPGTLHQQSSGRRRPE